MYFFLEDVFDFDNVLKLYCFFNFGLLWVKIVKILLCLRFEVIFIGFISRKVIEY